MCRCMSAFPESLCMPTPAYLIGASSRDACSELTCSAPALVMQVMPCCDTYLDRGRAAGSQLQVDIGHEKRVLPNKCCVSVAGQMSDLGIVGQDKQCEGD